jgi:hypothetical protein
MLIGPSPGGAGGCLVGVVGLLPIRVAHAALRAATAAVVGLAFSARAGTPSGNIREGFPPCPARQSAERSTGSGAGPSYGSSIGQGWPPSAAGLLFNRRAIYTALPAAPNNAAPG